MRAYLILRKGKDSKRWNLDSFHDFVYDREIAEARVKLQALECRGYEVKFQIIELDITEREDSIQSAAGDPEGSETP